MSARNCKALIWHVEDHSSVSNKAILECLRIWIAASHRKWNWARWTIAALFSQGEVVLPLNISDVTAAIH